MSEILRELVVALSLDSDNFARNLRTINKQIEEAESAFNLAGAGIDKFESSVQGTPMQNNADAIYTAKTNLNNAKAAVKTTEAEIRKLTKRLYRQKSIWTQAATR